MIGVSSCLAGVKCTYRGDDNLVGSIKELVDQNKAIMICPEVLGGLTIPRYPCEIIDGKVINNQGEDKTKEYTEVFDVDEIKDFDGYKGGWTIVEYITKETPVKKGGISFNDWLTQNNIYHLDMSFDNCIGAYVTDLGGIDAEC